MGFGTIKNQNILTFTYSHILTFVNFITEVPRVWTLSCELVTVVMSHEIFFLNENQAKS